MAGLQCSHLVGRPGCVTSRPRLQSRGHAVDTKRSLQCFPARAGLRRYPDPPPAPSTSCNPESSNEAPTQARPESVVVPVLVASLAACLVAHPATAAIADIASAAGPLEIPGVVGDDPLREGIVSGFLLIFFSEIGDKTFFIALLLALQKDKTSVFAGTFGALAVMTVISVSLGQVLHQLDELLPASPVPVDDVLAAALLTLFGVQTLLSAADAEQEVAEEKSDAEEVVSAFGTPEAGLILSTFLLVFAAEWGDKSFLATIALAAASSPLGVTIGAVAGHGVATVLAVTSGDLLSGYVDEKTVKYAGGSLFLLFAASTVFDLVTSAPV